MPNRYFSLFLAAITVVGLQMIWGYYWEDTMAVHAAAIHGSISSPMYSAWFNEALLFQIPILAYLSEMFPAVPILGFWLLAKLILIFSVWYQLTLRVLLRSFQIHQLLIILISILFVVPIIGFSLEYIHLSRIAILLTAGSLLLCLDYYIYEGRKPILLIFLFVIGILARVHVGVLVLVTLSLFIVLVTRNFRITTSLLKHYWFITMICLAVVITYKYGSGNPALEIEQTYEYALSDRKAILPLSEMKTKEDSVRYVALTKYFLISDSAQINIPFFKKIIDLPDLSDPLIKSDVFSHLSSNMHPFWQSQGLILFMFYTLLLILMWRCNRNAILNIVVVNLFGWAVIVILCLAISISERFLIPWVTMLVCTSLWFIFFNNRKVDKSQKAIAVPILLIMSVLIFQKINSTSIAEKEYNLKAYQYLKNLEAVCMNQIPVIWDYNYLSFPSEVLAREKLSVYKGCIYQSHFFLLYYDFGGKRCMEKTGCSPLDWRCMNFAFNENKLKYCFIMEEHMALFLNEYYNVLYNLNFTLTKSDPPLEITPGNFVFHVKDNNTEQNPASID